MFRLDWFENPSLDYEITATDLGIWSFAWLLAEYELFIFYKTNHLQAEDCHTNAYFSKWPIICKFSLVAKYLYFWWKENQALAC